MIKLVQNSTFNQHLECTKEKLYHGEWCIFGLIWRSRVWDKLRVALHLPHPVFFVPRISLIKKNLLIYIGYGQSHSLPKL